MTSGMLRQVNNKGDTSRSSPLVRALRATCCVLRTIRGMLHKCHLPKRDNKSVCLSAQLLFSCGMPLIVMDLYQNLIMSNISLVNAAAQLRLSAVCPFGETTVPLSCCPVCHRASRSCGCQTKLAKKLLPLPLPLTQPQPLPLPLPSATS